MSDDILDELRATAIRRSKAGWLTPRDVWEIMSVSRSVVYRLLDSGHIESVRFGDCHRIPVAALLRYVKEQNNV